MRIDLVIEIALWIIATLVSSVVVILAIAQTWSALRDPKLAADPNALVYRDILWWEMAEHAIRVLMEALSWVLVIAGLAVPPPDNPPPVTPAGMVSLWSLMGFRLLLTAKNVMRYEADQARRRRAERRVDALRRVAMRRAQQAAQAGGIAPEPDQETLGPRTEHA